MCKANCQLVETKEEQIAQMFSKINERQWKSDNPLVFSLLVTTFLFLLASAVIAAAPAPGTITLSAGAATDTSVQLSWAASRLVGLQYYEVGYGLSSSAITSWKSAGTATSTTVNGLSPATLYYFQVRALTKKGTVLSNIVSKQTLATPPLQSQPPSAPTNLTATAVSSSQINLTWQDNSTNETGFRIERASSSAGPFTQIATVGAETTTYSNTGLSASTTYYYRVCAYNSDGNSPYSNVASATTQAVLNPPIAPSNLSATAVSSSQINLTWQDKSSNETGFRIERSLSATSGYTLIATVSANVTTYSNVGLSEYTTYYYRVCAYNADGNSGYTNIASAVTPLNPPTNLTATAVSSTQVNLAWTDNSSAESNYVIERSVGTASTWSVLATLPANTTTYSDTTCQPATTYYYRVKAKGSDSAYCGPIAVTTPSATPVINPQWVGRTPVIGAAYKAAVRDNYAYVVSSLGLQIFDISNRSQPLARSSLAIASPYTIAVGDAGYAFIGSGANLKVVNVVDPRHPQEVATLPMSDSVCGLCVSGNTVYAACYTGGLVIVDASQPTKPSILGSLDTAGEAYAVSVTGTLAVVADGSAGLKIIDVSVPSAPRLLGSLATSDIARDVVAVSGKAYVAASKAGLVIANIANPSAPYVLGTAAPRSFGQAVSVRISGNQAFVGSCGANGVQVFDVSNPPSCVELSFTAVGGTMRGLEMASGILCLACQEAGLVIVDVQTPSAPRILAQNPQITRATAFAVEGQYLYTVGQSYMRTVPSLLQVFDISDPSAPNNVARMELACPNEVVMNGGYAFVGDATTLKILDIGNPGSPSLVSTITMPDYVMGIATSGNTLYAACYSAGLVVVDITNPSAPRQIASLDTPGEARAVSLTGSLAVLADGSAGVQLIDISNPCAPRIVGSLATTDLATDVYATADYAFVAATRAGLLAVDIRNPASPLIIGTGSPKAFAWTSGVVVAGSYAFVACTADLGSSNGLQVFNIENPTSLKEVSFLASNGTRCYSVAVYDGMAFLSDDKYLVDIADL